MITVKLTGYKKASARLATEEFAVFVSIGHAAGDGQLICPVTHSLRLGFKDESPTWDEQGLPDNLDILCTVDDVRRLIGFARVMPDGATVLVQGRRGRSRATAAAAIMLVATGSKETPAMRNIKEQCAAANPNPACPKALRRTGFCNRPLTSWANDSGSLAKMTSRPETTGNPSQPIVVETIGQRIAIASSTLSRVPPPLRRGTT